MGDDTPEVEPVEMPGFDAGVIVGYKLGVARTLEQFRVALIAHGHDPGEAYLLAEDLQRWINTHGG